MRSFTHSLAPLALLAAGTLVLTSCGSSSDDADGNSDAGSIQIVASTNVYGDIASSIAGNDADVTSIMTDEAQDPHSFEANSRTQLTVSKADIVIENGGGYDDFMDTLLKASKNTDATVLNAVDISGKQAPDGEELNEHVWYDLPTVEKVADEIASALGEADASHKQTYEQNAADFKAEVAKVEDRAAEIKQAHDGEGVAITEPVPLYLLEAAGLKNRTPEEFSEAIEEESDVPPAVLQDTLDLFADGKVKVLVANAQTTSAQTEKVEAAAKSAGVPIVHVTEILPENSDYVSWMTSNLDAVSDALDGGTGE